MIAAELREAYNGNIEDVDLLIGSLAEARPEGFGFGDTPFHLFLCMANRRLKTDRYFNDGVRWGFKLLEMSGGVWKRLIDKTHTRIVNRKEMRTKRYRPLKRFLPSKTLNCDWKILALLFCKIRHPWPTRLTAVRPLHYPVAWYKISHARMQPTQWDFQNRANNSYQSIPNVYLTLSAWLILYHVTGSCRGLIEITNI